MSKKRTVVKDEKNGLVKGELMERAVALGMTDDVTPVLEAGLLNAAATMIDAMEAKLAAEGEADAAKKELAESKATAKPTNILQVINKEFKKDFTERSIANIEIGLVTRHLDIDKGESGSPDKQITAYRHAVRTIMSLREIGGLSDEYLARVDALLS